LPLSRILLNFLRHSNREKLLVFEALWYLMIIKIQLRYSSFNALAKRYNLQMTQNELCAQDENIETLKSIKWALWRVSRIIPWDSVCLDQALSAQRMLARRKISGVLYLGVAKKETEVKGLKAHAWVRTGKYFVTGQAGHEEFTVVSCFGW